MKKGFIILTAFILLALGSGCVPCWPKPDYRRTIQIHEQQLLIIEGFEKEIERLNHENENLRLMYHDIKLRFQAAWAQRSRIDRFHKGPKTIIWCDPDGEVMLADNEKRMCQVNLGREEGVKTGIIFEVFCYVKGGTRKVKGRIEITKVEDSVSQATIIELVNLKEDLIVKGDRIISPLFDKEEVQELVLAGMLISSKYTKKELAKLIEKMGAKVVTELTVETDFFVAGKHTKENEDYQRALDLGITILSEKELFEYIDK